IAGAVVGCLITGFYLLRQYDVTTATYIAGAFNIVVAGIALVVAASAGGAVREAHARQRVALIDNRLRSGTSTLLAITTPAYSIYLTIAISGLCAMAAETVWTRILALLLGGSVYTFAIILAVFLFGLGTGGAIGSSLSRSPRRTAFALGWCQLLSAAAIAWT